MARRLRLLLVPLLALVAAGPVGVTRARPAHRSSASSPGTASPASCWRPRPAPASSSTPSPRGSATSSPPGCVADLITVSHEHPDHNNVAMAASKPRVIHGLTADHKGWARVDESYKDVAIRTVGVYHDAKRGAERGLNTVFIFEVGGLRIAHLGDLGHALTDDQRAKIGAVDVVLVPVGGTFTVDGRAATRVVEQLRPRLMVIPMHYKTEAVTIKELEPLEPFLERKVAVRHESARTLSLSPLKARTAAETVVLPYR